MWYLVGRGHLGNKGGPAAAEDVLHVHRLGFDRLCYVDLVSLRGGQRTRNETREKRKSLDRFFSIFVHFCDTQEINTKHFETRAFSFALLAKISKSLLQCSRRQQGNIAS